MEIAENKMYSNRWSENRTVRKSSEDRAKEILEKYKKPSESVMSSADAGLPMNTLRSQWEKLMESDDLDEPSPVKIAKESSRDSSSLSSESMQAKPRQARRKYDVSDNDSTEDSLSISDTDMQVGALAKKLATEKTNERIRMSAESGSDRNPSRHITASPHTMANRSQRKDFSDKQPSPLIGTSALSSILKSDDGIADSISPRDIVRFGSVGVSDGDLLNTLTGASKKNFRDESPLNDADSLDYRDLDSSKGQSYIESKSFDKVNKQTISRELTGKENSNTSALTLDEKFEEDDVYSFNEFEDDDGQPQDSEQSPNLMPQLIRTISVDLPILSQSKSQEVKESIEDIDRRKSIEAIWTRWNSTSSRPPEPEKSNLGVEAINDIIRGTPSSDRVLRDDSSEVADSNKSDNQGENNSPLNLGENRSIPLNESKNETNTENFRSNESINDVLADYNSLEALSNQKQPSDIQSKVNEIESTNKELEITQMSVSNLIVSPSDHRHSFRANRYSDIDDNEEFDLYSPPQYSSKPTEDLEAFPVVSGVINVPNDSRDTHPHFLKRVSNPPVIEIKANEIGEKHPAWQSSTISQRDIEPDYISEQRKPLSAPPVLDPRNKLSAMTAAKIKSTQRQRVRDSSVKRGSSSERNQSKNQSAEDVTVKKRLLISENSRLLLAKRQQRIITAKRDISPELPIETFPRGYDSKSILDNVPLRSTSSKRNREQKPAISPSVSSRFEAKSNKNQNPPSFDYKMQRKPLISTVEKNPTPKQVGKKENTALKQIALKSSELNALQKDLNFQQSQLQDWEDSLREKEEELRIREEESFMNRQQEEAFEEEVLLKQHVTKLEDDLEDLKARLFETIEERDSLKDELANLKSHQSLSAHAQDCERKDEGDNKSLEILLAGYQKENEKLVQALKKREAEERQLKSQFFDQQESMNKELNRLRNLSKGVLERASGDGTRKSSSQFRSELDADSSIRYLEERLAEVEGKSSAKEKELNEYIEKLRKDYRQLADKSSEETSNLYNDFKDKIQSFQQDLEIKNKLIDEQKKRLDWYAENQTLLDKAYEERDALSSEIHELQNEIARLGGHVTPHSNALKKKSQGSVSGPGSVTKSKHQNKREGNFGEEKKIDDHSILLENTSVSIPFKRSPGDIKKIRELEATIQDLNEIIQRRYPDSVSGIIRAASFSDASHQELLRKHKEHINSLQDELEEAKNEHQLKLRSLRQEHEQLKSKYESLLSETRRQSHANAKPHEESPRGRINKDAKNSKPSNLNQALARIKELEEEIERVRRFYTGKIESLRKQLENNKSMPSDGLKAAVPDTVQMQLQQVESDCKVHDTELQMELDRSNNTISQLNSKLYEYEQKIAILEKSIQQQQQQQQQSIPQPPTEWIKSIQEQHIIQLNNQKESSAIQLEQVLHDREKILRESNIRQEQALKEQHALWERVKEEETRSAKLSIELEYVKKQLDDYQKTPASIQLQTMEMHISLLERRLEGREKELRATLQDSKLAGKLELSRLQGIHEKELREKDEELSKFQYQLEQVVSVLRNMQQM